MIIDQCLGAETQQLMFIVLSTALFVKEDRLMETKHSLVNTPKKFLSQRHDLAQFGSRRFGSISDTKGSMSDLLICEAGRRGPRAHAIDLIELVMFQMCFRRLFRDELRT